jgi:hypothetical protein
MSKLLTCETCVNCKMLSDTRSKAFVHQCILNPPNIVIPQQLPNGQVAMSISQPVVDPKNCVCSFHKAKISVIGSNS